MGKNAPKNYQPHLFRCEKNSKAPKLEYGSWKDKKQRISPKKALWWLKNEGNIGIAGMPDDCLVNVDIDDEEITKKSDLKPTLMTRSRSRLGLHAYYFSKDDIPNIPTDNAGEIRAKGQYVIAPGSYVPCNAEVEMAGYYTIEEENPVSWIRVDDLPEVFLERKRENEEEKDFEPREFNPKKISENHSALFDLEARDVVMREGGSTNPTDRWTALFHDSSTSMNMSLSDKGLLQCWRHNVSHNGLQALTVLSGYMCCIEAGSPHKNSNAGPSMVPGDDGAIFNAWVFAKREGYIPKNDPVPTRALKHIARKHDIYDAKKYEMLPKGAYHQTLHVLEVDY